MKVCPYAVQGICSSNNASRHANVFRFSLAVMIESKSLEEADEKIVRLFGEEDAASVAFFFCTAIKCRGDNCGRFHACTPQAKNMATTKHLEWKNGTDQHT